MSNISINLHYTDKVHQIYLTQDGRQIVINKADARVNHPTNFVYDKAGEVFKEMEEKGEVQRSFESFEEFEKSC